MIYVLIVMSWLIASGRGGTEGQFVTFQEFGTRDACEAAKSAIEQWHSELFPIMFTSDYDTEPGNHAATVRSIKSAKTRSTAVCQPKS